MLFVFVCGAPVSGRTTTTKELLDYFLMEADVRVKCVAKDKTGRYDPTAILYQLYKTVIEDSADVVVIDGCAYDVFDRAEMLDEITNANNARTTPLELKAVAINLNRTGTFIFEHNEDAGHQPYERKTIGVLMNRVQPPILREGFELVYQVRRDQHIDLNSFIPNLNKAGFDFPYTPKPDFSESGVTKEPDDER